MRVVAVAIDTMISAKPPPPPQPTQPTTQTPAPTPKLSQLPAPEGNNFAQLQLQQQQHPDYHYHHHRKLLTNTESHLTTTTPKHKHSALDRSMSGSGGHGPDVAKRISDLPLFVAIEGCQVASYSLSGEPHLCLPQLLQNLRQKFTLKRMVDKFEETIINFTSASPIQVDGFKKACVLPPSAETCPLIKRSDADRICLGLFEQCYKGPKNDILDMCAATVAGGSQYNLKPNESEETNANEYKSDSDKQEQDIINQPTNLMHNRRVSASTSPPPSNQTTSSESHWVQTILSRKYESRSITARLVNNINDQANATTNATISSDHQQHSNNTTNFNCIKGHRPCDCGGDGTSISLLKSEQSTANNDGNQPILDFHQKMPPSDNIRLDNHLHQQNLFIINNINGDDDRQRLTKLSTTTTKTTTILREDHLDHSIKRDNPLFESEARGSLLALAKAVTSTLKIRVYHKCFGKCVGLFYPSQLRDTRSLCIECTNCHIMFTPRRFIGHTHGPKEKDVCHWGFNSYNWRCYVRLSKKQPMNNLDDDELLNKFKALQSAPDPEGSTCMQAAADDENYEFDKPYSDDMDHIKIRDLDNINNSYKDNILVNLQHQQQQQQQYQQYSNYIQQSLQQRQQLQLQQQLQILHHQQRDRINPEMFSNYYYHQNETELMRRNATSNINHNQNYNTKPIYGTKAKNESPLDFLYQHYRGTNSCSTGNYMLNLDHHNHNHHVNYSTPHQDQFNRQKLIPSSSSTSLSLSPPQPPRKVPPPIAAPYPFSNGSPTGASAGPTVSRVSYKRPYEALDFDYTEANEYQLRQPSLTNRPHQQFDKYNYQLQHNHDTGLSKRPTNGRSGHRYIDLRRTTTHIEPNNQALLALPSPCCNRSGSTGSTNLALSQPRRPHNHPKHQKLLFTDISKCSALDRSMSGGGGHGPNVAKRISDLPLFVAIEGCQVASYSLSGEPHLCLPQLLQNLRQKFTLKRMVDKFEETIINFTSASPIQVDGFKKACVLPPSAETCPLIKRSDADRICLGLFEQCYKGPKNDILDMCAATIAGGSQYNLKPNESEETNANEYKSDSDKQEQDINQPTNFRYHHHHHHHHQVPASSNLIASASESWVQSILSQYESREDLFKSLKQLVGHQASESSPVMKEVMLFENEAQKSILTLAKAVTSTLKIRVYHKCFGKCVGLFYPSQLRDTRSLCIECTNCHIMFTPRRFIGHTHGPKEKDVCHWGFNSYNWRCYVRLSKKQPMNNLDDDELLNKFKALQSAPDPEGSTCMQAAAADDENYEFDKPDLDEMDTRQLRGDTFSSGSSSSSYSNCSGSTSYYNSNSSSGSSTLRSSQHRKNYLHLHQQSVMMQHEEKTSANSGFRDQLIELANETTDNKQHINS